MIDVIGETGGPPDQHESFRERLLEVQERLRTVAGFMPHAWRFSTAGTLGVADLLLERLGESVSVDSHLARRAAAGLAGTVEGLEASVTGACYALPGIERQQSIALLVKRLESDVTAIQAFLRDEGRLVDSELDHHDGLVERAREGALATAAVELDERLRRLDRELARHRAVEEERTEQFQRLMRDFKEASVDELERCTQQFVDKLEDVVSRSEQVGAEAQVKSARAEELRGAAALLRETVNYEAAQERESKAADRWRRAALGFAIAGVLSLLLSGLWFAEDSQWVPQVLGHVASSVALGGIAGYCSHQSEGHRRLARELGFKHLAVSASPFIAKDLPDSGREMWGGLLVQLLARADLGAPDPSVPPLQPLRELLLEAVRGRDQRERLDSPVQGTNSSGK